MRVGLLRKYGVFCKIIWYPHVVVCEIKGRNNSQDPSVTDSICDDTSIGRTWLKSTKLTCNRELHNWIRHYELCASARCCCIRWRECGGCRDLGYDREDSWTPMRAVRISLVHLLKRTDSCLNQWILTWGYLEFRRFFPKRLIIKSLLLWWLCSHLKMFPELL